jgi:hypothetical protein
MFSLISLYLLLSDLSKMAEDNSYTRMWLSIKSSLIERKGERERDRTRDIPEFFLSGTIIHV